MEKATRNPVAGFFFSLLAAGMWGVLPVTLKELLRGMDAQTIVWYRFLVAAALLAPWLAWQGRLPLPRQFRGTAGWWLLLAAAGLCGNYFLFAFALNFINGETAEAVIQLTTLFLIFGGVLFYGEPFSIAQKLGTALIVLGMALFFNDRLQELLDLGSEQTIGVLIVLAAAVTWTIYALLQKKLHGDFSSAQVLLFIYLFSTLVLLPFIDPGTLLSLDGPQLGLLAFCCLNTLIAYGAFAEALKFWDASKVSAVLVVAPLFTIGTLKLVVYINPEYAFSDRLTLLSIGGAVLLVLGSALTAIVVPKDGSLRESALLFASRAGLERWSKFGGWTYSAKAGKDGERTAEEEQSRWE